MPALPHALLVPTASVFAAAASAQDKPAVTNGLAEPAFPLLVKFVKARSGTAAPERNSTAIHRPLSVPR